jgi:rubrerythrin
MSSFGLLGTEVSVRLAANKSTGNRSTCSALTYPISFNSIRKDRYPNHEARKRIEEEHHDELEKLASPDADYFHGIHSGLLAASRMYQKQADILHINKHDEVSDVLLSEAANHAKKVEESLEEFPKVEVGNLPTGVH